MDGGADRAIAIVHDMKVHEDFEMCAQRLFLMVKACQEKYPGKRRTLYLSIQGHRNSLGGFDADAHEILTEYMLGFLMHYLSEATTPTYKVTNPRGQKNDVPDELSIADPDEALRSKTRDHKPDDRLTKPSLQAITDYLGLDEPCCLICWRKPAERAHARPAALQGSNDVRNFALLCRQHHEQAPDVLDSNSFWQWVDWKLSTDGPFSGNPRTARIDEKTSFFTQIHNELTELYGWPPSALDDAKWTDLMSEMYGILDKETSNHFGIRRKASTHAWAMHRSLVKLTGEVPRRRP